MPNEPMSAERLAEIRHAIAHARIGNSKVLHRSIAEDLLAEWDRLAALVRGYRDTHGCEKADRCDLCKAVDHD